MENQNNYVCQFCGCKCNCKETSREFNRKVLYFSAIVYVIFASVLVGIAAEAFQRTEWLILFPWLKEAIQAFVIVASLMLLLAIMLILSTWRRVSYGIVGSLFSMAVLLSIQIGFGSEMIDKINPDNFDEYVATDYLANWQILVSMAESDSSIRLFIMDVQDEYDCCGWNDYADDLQNPSYLECTPDLDTKTCSGYFESYISTGFEAIAVLAIVSTTIQLTMMVLSCSLILRCKRFYKPVKVDTGDWIDPAP